MAILSSAWRAASSPVEAYRRATGRTADEATATRLLRQMFGAKAPMLIAENAKAQDLAAQFEAKFGHRPHHRMKPDTIRARLAE